MVSRMDFGFELVKRIGAAGTIARRLHLGYCMDMNDLKEFDPFVCTEKSPYPEDEATLAAIDAGIRDSDAGRVVSYEEVLKLIPQWIAKYSLQTPR